MNLPTMAARFLAASDGKDGLRTQVLVFCYVITHAPSPSLCSLGLKQITGPPTTLPRTECPKKVGPRIRTAAATLESSHHSHWGGRHGFRSESSPRVCGRGGSESAGVMWEDGGIDRDLRSRPVGALWGQQQ